MVNQEEFRKTVLKDALLRLRAFPKSLKCNLRYIDDEKLSIILYQIAETSYIVKCMDEETFRMFTKTHRHSWWVLREGKFTAISSLSLLHDNTLDALGV